METIRPMSDTWLYHESTPSAVQRDARVAAHEAKAKPALVHVEEDAGAVPVVPGRDGVRGAVGPQRRDDGRVRPPQELVDLRRERQPRHG